MFKRYQRSNALGDVPSDRAVVRTERYSPVRSTRPTVSATAADLIILITPDDSNDNNNSNTQ